MINKFDMQQDIERVLVSEEDIHARIREVGAQISEDYRDRKSTRLNSSHASKSRMPSSA